MTTVILVAAGVMALLGLGALLLVMMVDDAFGERDDRWQ